MSGKRPYVICQMAPSVDGRIVTTHWKLPSSTCAEYERTAATFAADAWIIGRVPAVADGGIGPSLFDASGRKPPARHLKLLSSEKKRKGDVLWLRCKVK